MSHAATSSLQIRTLAKRPAGAAIAPHCWLVPVRIQQGVGVAVRTLRTRGEEARLWRPVLATHRVAQQRGNVMAGQCACSSLATDAQGFGPCLKQFLRQAGRLPALQKERPIRQFPLPRPETEQTRPSEQPPVPAQARLSALPQQPRGVGNGEERHREPVRRQVVREHPDRARG